MNVYINLHLIFQKDFKTPLEKTKKKICFFNRMALLICKMSLCLTLSYSLYINSFCAVLSHFSRVQFFVTPWTIASQAPLSLGILQARILERVV